MTNNIFIKSILGNKKDVAFIYLLSIFILLLFNTIVINDNKIYEYEQKEMEIKYGSYDLQISDIPIADAQKIKNYYNNSSIFFKYKSDNNINYYNADNIYLTISNIEVLSNIGTNTYIDTWYIRRCKEENYEDYKTEYYKTNKKHIGYITFNTVTDPSYFMPAGTMLTIVDKITNNNVNIRIDIKNDNIDNAIHTINKIINKTNINYEYNNNYLYSVGLSSNNKIISIEKVATEILKYIILFTYPLLVIILTNLFILKLKPVFDIYVNMGISKYKYIKSYLCSVSLPLCLLIVIYSLIINKYYIISIITFVLTATTNTYSLIYYNKSINKFFRISKIMKGANVLNNSKYIYFNIAKNNYNYNKNKNKLINLFLIISITMFISATYTLNIYKNSEKTNIDNRFDALVGFLYFDGEDEMYGGGEQEHDYNSVKNIAKEYTQVDTINVKYKVDIVKYDKDYINYIEYANGGDTDEAVCTLISGQGTVYNDKLKTNECIVISNTKTIYSNEFIINNYKKDDNIIIGNDNYIIKDIIDKPKAYPLNSLNNLTLIINYNSYKKYDTNDIPEYIFLNGVDEEQKAEIKKLKSIYLIDINYVIKEIEKEQKLINNKIYIIITLMMLISGIGIYATLNIRYTAHYKEFSELVRMGVPSNKITKIITIETSLHYIYTIILSTILTYMVTNIINKIIIDSTGIYLPYKYPYAGITITIFIITLLIISTIILIKNKIIKSTEVITE